MLFCLGYKILAAIKLYRLPFHWPKGKKVRWYFKNWTETIYLIRDSKRECIVLHLPQRCISVLSPLICAFVNNCCPSHYSFIRTSSNTSFNHDPTIPTSTNRFQPRRSNILHTSHRATNGDTSKPPWQRSSQASCKRRNKHHWKHIKLENRSETTSSTINHVAWNVAKCNVNTNLHCHHSPTLEWKPNGERDGMPHVKLYLASVFKRTEAEWGVLLLFTLEAKS